MTDFLTHLLGRLPIGWLQLTHNKTRMAAALAGVAFANILVFIQLGMLGALNGTIAMSYKPFNADIIISAADANTLADGSNISRRYLYQALSMNGIKSGTPLYIANLEWTRPDGNSSNIQVYGLPPESLDFIAKQYQQDFKLLKLQNTVLIDDKTRGLSKGQLPELSPVKPFSFEVNGLTLNGVGTYSIGGGFSADGTMMVSDQTFLRLFPKRIAGTPSHLLLYLDNHQEPLSLINQLQQHLNTSAIKVRTFDQTVSDDLKYQTTQRPIGVIFGFGVFIGLLVGLVIVYQVLATDVADHIREYATFKAIGYNDRFFLGVIFEEAITLAILGFIPGAIIASGIYIIMASATGLPISMEISRMFLVFIGTVMACMISGYIATRRLAAADPADLF